MQRLGISGEESTDNVVDFPKVNNSNINSILVAGGAGRAAELLGWRPQVNVEDGLAATVTYFDNALRRSATGKLRGD